MSSRLICRNLKTDSRFCLVLRGKRHSCKFLNTVRVDRCPIPGLTRLLSLNESLLPRRYRLPYYEPSVPTAPACPAGIRLNILTTLGLPCCVPFLVYMLSPLPRALGGWFRSVTQPYQPSPVHQSVLPSSFEACSAFTRVTAHTRAVHNLTRYRTASPFRFLHSCSGCSGWSVCRVGFHHWKRALPRRTQMKDTPRPFGADATL